MRILGIDPGLKGALALWDGSVLEVVDVPIVKARSRGNEVNLPSLVDIINSWDSGINITAVYIEKNSSRPNEGVSSARKGGLVEGILLGCVAAHCRNIVRVTPNQWKKRMGLTSDKNYSRTRAIESFPNYHKLFARKMDDGRAEASLLALYGFVMLQDSLIQLDKPYIERGARYRRKLKDVKIT